MNKVKSSKAGATHKNSVSKWLDSPEGQKEVQKAVERGLQICQELRESRQVSQETLREPFTL